MTHAHPDPCQSLYDELTQLKDGLRQVLRDEPDNLPAHRVYCAYVGKILNLQKLRIQAQAADWDTVLVHTLKAVVRTLMEQGEQQAAEAIGEHLETIEHNVRERWQHSTERNWPEVTTKSGSSSNPRQLPSGSLRRGRKKSAKRAP